MNSGVAYRIVNGTDVIGFIINVGNHPAVALDPWDMRAIFSYMKVPYCEYNMSSQSLIIDNEAEPHIKNISYREIGYTLGANDNTLFNCYLRLKENIQKTINLRKPNYEYKIEHTELGIDFFGKAGERRCRISLMPGEFNERLMYTPWKIYLEITSPESMYRKVYRSIASVGQVDKYFEKFMTIVVNGQTI